MNAALALGAEHLRSIGCDPVIGCVGDLPALTPDSVRAVLATVGKRERAYLADAAGPGTTMLITAGMALHPLFQGRSAAAHRASGARAITDRELPRPIVDARTDVDDLPALADAISIGVGPHTARLIDPEARTVAQYQPITVAAGGDADDHPVITDSGVRLRLPAAALDPRIRVLRPGQRLHAARLGDRILSAWF